MTTPSAPKKFRVHPVLVGILAVAAAVGIAGLAAYYAIPASRDGGSPIAPDTPGPAGPPAILRVEAQQKAMEALFALARDRQQTGVATALGDVDKRAIAAAVGTVAEPAADPLDGQGLIWMFARTCEGYRFVVTDGSAAQPGPYAPVFDAAFWEAAGRLAKSPGPAAGGFLAQLARPLTAPQDRKRMDALVRAQHALKAKPAATPRPTPAPVGTPTPHTTTAGHS